MKAAALTILEKLRQSGFEAYFAGGSVRDMLLGKPAKDYDIATSATPDQIETLFAKTRSIGKHFGVMLVEEAGHHIEVATFRADSDYSDGRRPDGVTFTTAQEDVKRRDFTINGLLYDPIEDKVLDFVDGQIDLKEHLIRFIGNPADRIQEDSLRILRAIRFKNRLGFRYHPDTFEALRQYSHLVTRVSSERIRDELNFLLLDASRSDSIRDLHEFGLLQILLPEIEKLRGVTQPFEYHTEGDAFEHTLHALESIGKTTNLTLVWA
nr:CCA tRNA nucleotidyltransferase [Candidatus Gracilibacteria bacterium]